VLISVRNTGRRRAPALPLLALLPLVVLAACGPRAEAVKAGLNTPAGFREATAPVQWPDPQWWGGFGSAELDRLMTETTAGNFDIAAAAARVRQADAQLRIAGSALLPTVDAGSSGSRQRSNGISRSSYDLQLSASYEVDFWGRNRSNRESAEQNLRASRFDAGAVAITTEASLANSFFQVLATQQQLRVQTENLEAARRILGVIRAQVAAGVATGLDLAQQETVVAQQEAQLPALRQTVAQGINAIAVLTGRPPQEFTLATTGFPALRIPEASPGQPAELLARRPDVLAAEASLASANANVAAARAALLPSVVLQGQGGFTSSAIGTLLRPDAQFYSLVASLAQTVFDGGALRGQVALSRAQAEELLVAYRRAIVTALQDVEDSLIALRETTRQEELRAEAATLAERASAIAEAQLRAGTINVITLLNTQQSLFSARVSLVEARLARLQAAVGLFRALGGGWR
jgi:NodT family efflux transporter outer membrane factor (OMF) lipoprotein